MSTGSCLCGAVRYQVAGPYRWMAHCHCSMCRKQHGSLYGTSLGVARENFQWVHGQDVVSEEPPDAWRSYSSSEQFERAFCAQCGSVAPANARDIVICPAGNLEDVGLKPQAHIFVASRSPSCEITDRLPRFDEYPPGVGAAVPSPQRAQAGTGVVSGSCLCGQVAFELDEVPTRMVNCHCSRCRASRGAAYATNVFVHKDKLRWTRGAEKVSTYRVPAARMYTTGFCVDCGSRMPSAFERINMYLVPVGALDTPLDLKPGVNIFVGSRAAWFDITDALPQFEAMPPRERTSEFFF